MSLVSDSSCFFVSYFVGPILMNRVADTLTTSRGGFLWNPAGFGLFLYLKMILVAVFVPSPALLTGSGCRSQRRAQVVDILSQMREVRHFSCCRTAGFQEVSDRVWGSTSLVLSPKSLFMLLLGFS